MTPSAFLKCNLAHFPPSQPLLWNALNGWFRTYRSKSPKSQDFKQFSRGQMNEIIYILCSWNARLREMYIPGVPTEQDVLVNESQRCSRNTWMVLQRPLRANIYGPLGSWQRKSVAISIYVKTWGRKYRSFSAQSWWCSVCLISLGLTRRHCRGEL